jgi:hypothetical protein
MASKSNSFFQAVANVQSSIATGREWECTEFWVDVATSLEDDTTLQLNLVSTFGEAFRVTKKRMLTGFECHWLPKRFNTDGGTQAPQESVHCEHG